MAFVAAVVNDLYSTTAPLGNAASMVCPLYIYSSRSLEISEQEWPMLKMLQCMWLLFYLSS